MLRRPLYPSKAQPPLFAVNPADPAGQAGTEDYFFRAAGLAGRLAAAFFTAFFLDGAFLTDFLTGLAGARLDLLVLLAGFRAVFFATAFFKALLARTVVFLSSPSDLEAGSLSSTRLRLFSLSDLKSVSYQPAPLSRNTGAEISRFSVGLPQLGHFLSGGSEIFCMVST